MSDTDRVSLGTADRADKIEWALRRLIAFQMSVNRDPKVVMSGLENDPEGLAIALFNGPVWDQAAEAING